MKDHAIIGKFMGIQTFKKDLIWWINTKWKPKGNYDLELGSKGFFMVIFHQLEDQDKVFDNQPYFFNYAGLYLRFRKERFNPDQEDFTYALVYIRMYSLPSEYWEPKNLEGMGNTVGFFIQVDSNATDQGRYTTLARICIYI